MADMYSTVDLRGELNGLSENSHLSSAFLPGKIVGYSAVHLYAMQA